MNNEKYGTRERGRERKKCDCSSSHIIILDKMRWKVFSNLWNKKAHRRMNKWIIIIKWCSVATWLIWHHHQWWWQFVDIDRINYFYYCSLLHKLDWYMNLIIIYHYFHWWKDMCCRSPVNKNKNAWSPYALLWVAHSKFIFANYYL